MAIRLLEVRNFRGIKSLNWTLKSWMSCLIGPCDSHKTTILEAIQYCLHPYWYLALDDSDFFGSDLSNEIQISATLDNLPVGLISEQKYGLLIRGVSNEGELHDEPLDGDERALTIRLRIDSSLEPEWTVVNDRTEGKPISHSDRALFGMYLLDDKAFKHLYWSKGSVLSRITEETTDARLALNEAYRNLRKSIDLTAVADLSKVMTTVSSCASRFGYSPRDGLVPKIDSNSGTAGLSAIGIHDGNIPLRAAGLGTRRLVSLALQLEVTKSNAIILIDEIEHGLEPFRLYHLLDELRLLTERSQCQILMTTHSPSVIRSLSVENLAVVRSTVEGETKCLNLDSSLQGTARSIPEVFLARKVVLCEGSTEVGILRELGKSWFAGKGRSYASLGVAIDDATGQEGPKRARMLRLLGFDVCYLVDSDSLPTLNPTVKDLEALGVVVVQWSDNMSTEERLAADLPMDLLDKIVEIAIEEKGRESVRDSLRAKGFAIAELPTTVAELISIEVPEVRCRQIIGAVCKSKGWIKKSYLGARVGSILWEGWPRLVATDLGIQMEKLMGWANG